MPSNSGRNGPRRSLFTPNLYSYSWASPLISSMYLGTGGASALSDAPRLASPAAPSVAAACPRHCIALQAASANATNASASSTGRSPRVRRAVRPRIPSVEGICFEIRTHPMILPDHAHLSFEPHAPSTRTLSPYLHLTHHVWAVWTRAALRRCRLLRARQCRCPRLRRPAAATAGSQVRGWTRMVACGALMRPPRAPAHLFSAASCSARGPS
mmetsp:Transcript_7072/g.23436  ORF Transcript_7072/g.23436 Transcript_7072/m.23436 type:complete len:213 (+) Transcript_7072:701-1339(+)